MAFQNQSFNFSVCDYIFKVVDLGNKHLNFYGTLSFTVIGGILYYAVVVVVLWLKLNSNDLKLFTAIIVAVFLSVPYLRDQSKSSFARLKKKGGNTNA